MAEQQQPEQQVECDDHDVEETPGYKVPDLATMQEMLGKDADDESLRKYKEQLLGDQSKTAAVPFPDNPNRVIVSKLGLVADDRDEVFLDLTGDIKEHKKTTFVIKEGCVYRIKIYFYVQREICSGLRYLHTVKRRGIKVDKENYMVGSYGPKYEAQVYTAPPEEAPKGMISRGTYLVKSTFKDDDKNVYLEWEWNLEIKKDWQ